MADGPVIYADVLFFVNLFTNLLLLKATALLTKSPVKTRFLILGAGAGAVYALLFLTEQMAVLALLPIKLITAAILIVLTFPYRSILTYLRQYLIFLIVSLLFAGIIFIMRFYNGHIYLNNGIVYYDISLLSLALCTIAAYLILSFLCRTLKNRPEKESFLPATVKLGGQELTLNGFWDTGNNLKDYFTGLPVVICEYEKLAPLLTDPQKEYAQSILYRKETVRVGAQTHRQPQGKPAFSDPPLGSGMRLIFLNTAGESSVLPAVKPESFSLYRKAEMESTDYDVLIALSSHRLMGGDADLILNRHLTAQ